MFNSTAKQFTLKKMGVEVAFQSKIWIYTQGFPTHGVLLNGHLILLPAVFCFSFWTYVTFLSEEDILVLTLKYLHLLLRFL